MIVTIITSCEVAPVRKPLICVAIDKSGSIAKE